MKRTPLRQYPFDVFYVLDGHSLLWRAFYAPMANLHAPDGEPTKATYGFCRTLMRLCRERKPSYLAVAFDPPKGTLRRCQWYPGYKGNRSKTDEVHRAFQVQRRRVKQILNALGVCILEVPGWEADDVIGTLARQCVSDDVHVWVCSHDQDLWQLLDDPRIGVYDPLTAEFLDRWGMHRVLGYGPELVVPVKTLAGCSGDNVPGVPGVGEKTAVKLLREYKNIESIVVACAMNQVRGKLAEKICRAHADGTLRLSRKLVTLNCAVSLDVRVEDLEFDGLDWKRAAPVFRLLNFKRWE